MFADMIATQISGIVEHVRLWPNTRQVPALALPRRWLRDFLRLAMR